MGDEVWNAAGALPVPLTNEYLFRAMLQRNPCVLLSLVCACYQIGPDTVRSAVVVNPVLPGAPVGAKGLFAQVRIRFADGTVQERLLPAPKRESAGRDHRFRADEWGKLFAAGTWEEIRPLMKENAGICAAAQTAYELLADEAVWRQCQQCS